MNKNLAFASILLYGMADGMENIMTPATNDVPEMESFVNTKQFEKKEKATYRGADKPFRRPDRGLESICYYIEG